MSDDTTDQGGFTPDVGGDFTDILIREVGGEIIKHAPDEAKAGGILGGGFMAASGGITLAQAAMAGVAMSAVATMAGFIAAGVAVGGAVGWIGKKCGWFD